VKPKSAAAALLRARHPLLAGGAAAALLAGITLAHGQGAGGVAGVVAGGIPYSPWLVLASFGAGGFAWSAWGWYVNKSKVEITDPKFKWGRFLKSGLSGIAVGFIVFALTSASEQETVTSALLQGHDGLVGPHEFAISAGAAFVIIAGMANLWRKVPRKRGA